jgi:hypothetical protein
LLFFRYTKNFSFLLQPRKNKFSFKRQTSAFVKFENPLRDIVEKISVVRYDNYRAVIFAQPPVRANCTVSASRWFVGSSSSSKNQAFPKRLQSATRRRSPPDRIFTGYHQAAEPSRQRQYR